MESHSSPVCLPWVVMPADADSFGPEFRAGALAAARQEKFSRIRFGVSPEMLSGANGIRSSVANPLGLICHAQDLFKAPAPEGREVPSVIWGDGPVEDWAVDSGSDVSICAVDNRAVGRMAAKYYLGQRRFRSFVYADSPAEKHCAWWRETRFSAFRATLQEEGVDRIVHFELSGCAQADPVADFVARGRRLPGPVAVFACCDRVARDALAFCEADGVVVPDAVAVLGVDDEKGICESADIPISSVRIEHGRLGWLAMGLELRMLARKSCGRKILLKPSEVVERSSTSRPPLQDVFVRRAWDFIRMSGYEVPTVAQVVVRRGASRSYLEWKFKEETGRTILEAVHLRMLEAVKLLALETDKSVTEIAESVGLSTSGLCTFFKRMFGTSIGEFRLANGLGR